VPTLPRSDASGSWMRISFVGSASSSAPIHRQRFKEHNLGRSADNNPRGFYVHACIPIFWDRGHKQLKS
jgi:hypothetical protein